MASTVDTIETILRKMPVFPYSDKSMSMVSLYPPQLHRSTSAGPPVLFIIISGISLNKALTYGAEKCALFLITLLKPMLIAGSSPIY